VSAALHPVKLDRHLRADEPLSLDELAATANREHAACESSERSTLRHALAAGAALTAARDHVEPGQWQRWLAANFAGNIDNARTYIRLHVHRDAIPEGVGIDQARRSLAGLAPSQPLGSGARRVTDEQLEVVRALKAQEVPVTQIARHLGKPTSTVQYWADGHARDKASVRARAVSERRAKERAALVKVEREKAIRAAVRKAGAALSEAYSMQARMAKVLAQAEAEATTDEARAALAEATGHYHKMSDAIVRALGVSK
jgi:hypothetical protein